MNVNLWRKGLQVMLKWAKCMQRLGYLVRETEPPYEGHSESHGGGRPEVHVTLGAISHGLAGNVGRCNGQ